MSTATSSTIQLTPASAAFVASRTTSLGPWVLGGFVDSVLMGVILCQTVTFYRMRPPVKAALQRYYNVIVPVVLFLSVLKTAQCIAVVWVQNVIYYADPDKARLLVSKAWWQVSMPLLSGIIGTTCQSFYCLRFYILSENWMFCILIICAMCLGLAGVCLSLAAILAGNATAKVMWLLVYLVGVFVADFLITSGTIYTLHRRNSGLERTTILINRLLRLVFESAIPPTIVATVDLMLTQTLGPELLWHMLLNISLGKVYVISLLYTLNSIHEYRGRERNSQSEMRRWFRSNFDFSLRSPMKSEPQNFVQTQVQVSTHAHVSVSSPAPSHSKDARSQVLEDRCTPSPEMGSSKRMSYAV